ncbi:uncharacterized protein EURHEDRAFT_399782 [Aspergillus ruber CBS 135680]|uniref:Uncharacterized protein n=1 Tax=Aspergillus ruber (strain CBS 135680) TaxID=1388766 RepID=A0A017SPE6_ASPRC|nr:uncharacterized protein EURHEDRAFT_399782 [Aspergillus ruber CBS 135680]EYE98494.1 hypothetical protein EURHEDRAFT_399782 [Aspergillus ruber CBS 135680]
MWLAYWMKTPRSIVVCRYDWYRAYRLRREGSLTRYKDRVAQLENAVENMSTSVLSLSQRLVQSGALESNPELAIYIHGIVLTCLRSVKEAGCKKETPDAPPASRESPFMPLRKQR